MLKKVCRRSQHPTFHYLRPSVSLLTPLYGIYFPLLSCFGQEDNQQVWLQVGAVPTFLGSVPGHSRSPLYAHTSHCSSACFSPFIMCSACSSKQRWLKNASFARCFINTGREAAAGVKRKHRNQLPKEGGESIPLLKWPPAEEFLEEGQGQPSWQVFRHCLYQRQHHLCW